MIFGLFWSVDAALKWKLILDGVDYSSVLLEGASGQPDRLTSWINYWGGLAQATPGFQYTVAIIETMIAVFILSGFLTNWTSAAGIIFSFLIWSTAEAFGGIFVPGATDIGTMPLYMAMFAGLIVVQAGRDKGVDAILRRKYPHLPFV